MIKSKSLPEKWQAQNDGGYLSPVNFCGAWWQTAVLSVDGNSFPDKLLAFT